jgi:hypothetical protein
MPITKFQRGRTSTPSLEVPPKKQGLPVGQCGLLHSSYYLPHYGTSKKLSEVVHGYTEYERSDDVDLRDGNDEPY